MAIWTRKALKSFLARMTESEQFLAGRLRCCRVDSIYQWILNVHGYCENAIHYAHETDCVQSCSGLAHHWFQCGHFFQIAWLHSIPRKFYGRQLPPKSFFISLLISVNRESYRSVTISSILLTARRLVYCCKYLLYTEWYRIRACVSCESLARITKPRSFSGNSAEQ